MSNFIVPHSSLSAEKIATFSALSSWDVHIMDSIIQRVPMAMNLASLLKAYEVALPEHGVDVDSDLIYYRLMLQLGLMRGANWVSIWKSVKERLCLQTDVADCWHCHALLYKTYQTARGEADCLRNSQLLRQYFHHWKSSFRIHVCHDVQDIIIPANLLHHQNVGHQASRLRYNFLCRIALNRWRGKLRAKERKQRLQREDPRKYFVLQRVMNVWRRRVGEKHFLAWQEVLEVKEVLMKRRANAVLIARSWLVGFSINCLRNDEMFTLL